MATSVSLSEEPLVDAAGIFMEYFMTQVRVLRDFSAMDGETHMKA